MYVIYSFALFNITLFIIISYFLREFHDEQVVKIANVSFMLRRHYPGGRVTWLHVRILSITFLLPQDLPRPCWEAAGPVGSRSRVHVPSLRPTVSALTGVVRAALPF